MAQVLPFLTIFCSFYRKRTDHGTNCSEIVCANCAFIWVGGFFGVWVAAFMKRKTIFIAVARFAQIALDQEPLNGLCLTGCFQGNLQKGKGPIKAFEEAGQ